jgi:hypothetical protein
MLVGASLANFGQDAAQPKDKKDEKKKEPAPLFGGKMGIKSSSTTKETASLGSTGSIPPVRSMPKCWRRPPAPRMMQKRSS